MIFSACCRHKPMLSLFSLSARRTLLIAEIEDTSVTTDLNIDFYY